MAHRLCETGFSSTGKTISAACAKNPLIPLKTNCITFSSSRETFGGIEAPRGKQRGTEPASSAQLMR